MLKAIQGCFGTEHEKEVSHSSIQYYLSRLLDTLVMPSVIAAERQEMILPVCELFVTLNLLIWPRAFYSCSLYYGTNSSIFKP